MSNVDRCPLWRPGECEGSAECPPRCPRYVAPDGTAYTVVRREECPPSVGEAVDAAFEPRPDAGLCLVATEGTEPVGRATLDVDDGGGEPAGRGEVELLADDDELATELGRQVVARADALALDRVVVEGPRAALRGLGAELDRDPAGGRLTVDLDGALVERLSLPPARRSEVAAGRDLSALVAPGSVAVVGATDREGAIGRVVTENLAASFDGDLFPVTPRRTDVLGRPAADSLADLAAPPDLAVIALPASAALDAVRRAGEAGVEAVAVLSAGFGEAGVEGQRREAELREVADAHDLALVGPNSMGVLSPRSGLNASFAPTLPDAGGVAILSHSGALVTAALDRAAATGVGVRDAVSLGNAAGVDEAALLRYWGNDPGTDVVFAYLEDVADGEQFVEAAREVTADTPVVALKAGESEAGARAAASHTGALVEDDAGFDAAFDAAGVVRARSLAGAFDLATAFARQPLPTGARVAVVSNAGGPAVLTTDAVADADLELAELSDGTVDRLEAALPDAASAANPVDVLGDADVDRFATALEAVLGDPGVDAAVVVSTPHPLVSQADLVAVVGDAARRYGTPVVTCLAGGPLPDRVTEALGAAGVPNYPDPRRAAATLAGMAEYARRRRRPREAPVRPPVDRERARSVLAAGADRGVLGVGAMALLDAYGVPTPDGELVGGRDAAAKAARRLGGEVVLKVASPDVPHKSDAGGVRVGVQPGEAGRAYEAVVDAVAAAAPEAEIEGVLVQEAVGDGVECLVGVTRHGRFGPVVTFGLGGVFVEHLDDVAHGLAPLSTADARRLVRGIDGASVLEGARGADPVDVEALADALVRLSWLAADHPTVAELEVNPLVGTPDGVQALDLHVSLD